MTAAACGRSDEGGRCSEGSHPEKSAREGAQDENHKFARNSGGEELGFQHHAFCIKCQDEPGEKRPRSVIATIQTPPRHLRLTMTARPWPARSAGRPACRSKHCRRSARRPVVGQATRRSFWFSLSHVALARESLAFAT